MILLKTERSLGHIAEYPSDESLEEEDVVSCLHSIEVVKKVCIDFINANGQNILGGRRNP